MIDKKDIDAYMSIKAPDSIREKVMAEQAKNNSRISSKVRMCYALAAALLVIIAVFAFLPDSKTQIYYSDKPLDKNAVIIKTADNPNARIALLSAKDIEEIPLTVKTDKKTDITVSHGNIIILGEDKATNAGNSVSIDSDTYILWSVELVSYNGGYTITVGNDSYCISVNNEAQWVLSKK